MKEQSLAIKDSKHHYIRKKYIDVIRISKVLENMFYSKKIYQNKVTISY